MTGKSLTTEIYIKRGESSKRFKIYDGFLNKIVGMSEAGIIPKEDSILVEKIENDLRILIGKEERRFENLVSPKNNYTQPKMLGGNK